MIRPLDAIRRRRPGKVVVLGGLNMDLIADLPRPAGPGETVEGTRFYTTPGGKGGNQAVAAGRLAGPNVVEMVGRVGRDSYGTEMRDFLTSAGVGTSYLRVDDAASSGVAIIFIDSTGQNYVNAIYGANSRCDEAQVNDATLALNGASVLLAQQEVPLATTHGVMRAARQSGTAVILDPAPARDVLPDGFLGLADILTPNQTEAEALCGIAVKDVDSATRAATEIRRTGVRGVIIKMGEMGAFASVGPTNRHFVPFRVPVVATVAAGDAFNAGLAVGLAARMPFEQAVWLGMATGAMCVTKPGAQESMPTLDETEQLLISQSHR